MSDDPTRPIQRVPAQPPRPRAGAGEPGDREPDRADGLRGLQTAVVVLAVVAVAALGIAVWALVDGGDDDRGGGGGRNAEAVSELRGDVRDLRRQVDDLPTAEVRDRAEFAKLVGEQINTVLYLVYGMLGLSILIALMGIANTLSLSTFERVRELGLLRAVGQVRRQTRTMVRLESLVVAAYGTLVGLAVGVVGAWVVIRADDSAQISRFQVPTGQLVAIALLGALAGVLASVRPAARAAKLDPLAAIAAG